MSQKPAFIVDIHVPDGIADINLSPDKREVFLVQANNIITKFKLYLEQLFAPSRYTIPVGIAIQTVNDKTISNANNAKVDVEEDDIIGYGEDGTENVNETMVDWDSKDQSDIMNSIDVESSEKLNSSKRDRSSNHPTNTTDSGISQASSKGRQRDLRYLWQDKPSNSAIPSQPTKKIKLESSIKERELLHTFTTLARGDVEDDDNNSIHSDDMMSSQQPTYSIIFEPSPEKPQDSSAFLSTTQINANELELDCDDLSSIDSPSSMSTQPQYQITFENPLDNEPSFSQQTSTTHYPIIDITGEDIATTTTDHSTQTQHEWKIDMQYITQNYAQYWNKRSSTNATNNTIHYTTSIHTDQPPNDTAELNSSHPNTSIITEEVDSKTRILTKEVSLLFPLHTLE